MRYRLNQAGFSAVEIVIALVVIAGIVALGWHAWAQYAVSNSSRTTTSSPAAKFTGAVTQDGCVSSSRPIGDTGCSITVDNKVVQIKPGNIHQPNGWGSVEGFSISHDITGWRVEVYARHSRANEYNLGGTQYFVKLLGPQPVLPGQGCVPTPGQVCPG